MAEIKAMTSQGEAMSRSLSESDLSEMCVEGPPSPQELVRSFSPSGGQEGHFQDRDRRRRRKGSESSQGTLKEGEGPSSSPSTAGSQGLHRPALPPKSKRVLQQQQHMSGGPTTRYTHTRVYH